MVSVTLACPWLTSIPNLTVCYKKRSCVGLNSGTVFHSLIYLINGFLQPWYTSMILLEELRRKPKCRNINGVAACPKFSTHLMVSCRGGKYHESEEIFSEFQTWWAGNIWETHHWKGREQPEVQRPHKNLSEEDGH